MRSISTTASIAIFCGCIVAFHANAFDFGPRPLFYVIDEAEGLKVSTNRFNEDQDDSLPYDELSSDLVIGPWYGRYRRLSQPTRTRYELNAPGHTQPRQEELEYDTRLDIVKLGYLDRESWAPEGGNETDIGDDNDMSRGGGGEWYLGLTHIYLDTALPAFTDDSLVAESIVSHTLG